MSGPFIYKKALTHEKRRAVTAKGAMEKKIEKTAAIDSQRSKGTAQ